MSAPTRSKESRAPGPRPVTACVLAAAVGLVVLLMVQAPRLRRGPLPVEVLDPTQLRPWGHALWSALAVAVCALVVAAGPLRRGAGAFGVAMAGGVAAAAAGWSLALARRAGGWTHPAEALAVGLLAGLAAPLLRDRGVPALLAVSLALAGLTAAARREALDEAREAARLTRLEQLVDESGHRRLVLAVPPATPVARLQALAWRRPGVDLLSVRRGSDEIGELAAAGWPVVAADGAEGGKWSTSQPAARLAATARLTPERGPVVFVTREPAPELLRLVAVTPAGALRGPAFEASRGAWLGSEALAAYRALVGPLPPRSPIAVRAKSDLPRAATTWFVLRLPMRP